MSDREGRVGWTPESLPSRIQCSRCERPVAELTDKCDCVFDGKRWVAPTARASKDVIAPAEVVDPIEQLIMSLKWEDDVQEQYKRRTVVEAVRHALDESTRLQQQAVIHG